MVAILETVSRDARILPPDQRLQLAHRLLESVDREGAAEAVIKAEEAWDGEIARRLARHDVGETKAIPAAEVFARLRQLAPDK